MQKLVMESIHNHLLLYFDLHLIYIINSFNLNNLIEWMNKFVIISTITKLIMSTIRQENMAEQNSMNKDIVVQDGREQMSQLTLVFLRMTNILLGGFLLQYSKMYFVLKKNATIHLYMKYSVF